MFFKESRAKSPILKPAVLAWCFYDWACSSFYTIVVTYVFATYFTTKIAQNEIIGTAQWGNASALAGLIIALVSPAFGAIADYSGRRKIWLACFTLLVIISGALLWFAKPEKNFAELTLILFVLGMIGVEVAMVFYNSLLPDLTPASHLGRVSGIAWAFGYLGGLSALIIVLFSFVQNTPAWLDTAYAEQIRICGPFVAVWFALFSLPLFILVKDHSPFNLNLKKAVKKGLNELKNTIISLHKQKNIFRFLLARMIYTDGLNTIFAFGGIYAAGTFGMPMNEIIIFGICMNISAGIGAFSFSWLDDFLGSKKVILISLVFLSIFASIILIVASKTLFWIFALSLAIFIGPSQAASRSLMVRLSSPERITEWFGFYAFSGKMTAFIGPWLLALITANFDSQRIGFSTIIGFFIVGGLILLLVNEPQKNNYE